MRHVPDTPVPPTSDLEERLAQEAPGLDDLRVLVVDNVEGVREVISRILEMYGALPTTAAGAAEAQALLAQDSPFDVVLLDVEMPGESGWTLLERMRSEGDATPVIFVTARQAVEERVRGLRLGADDYVLKPFVAADLVARVQAVVRRRRAMPVLRTGDLRVDLGRRTVERAGRRIEVSPREFDLLRVLAEARGEPVSRQVLLREVWAMDFDPGTSIVEVLVTRLRRKVDRASPALIQTVVGVGYRLGVARPPGASPEAPEAPEAPESPESPESPETPESGSVF